MKARHKQSISTGAEARVNRSKNTEYPKDNRWMNPPSQSSNFRYNSWCVACRVSFKGSYGVFDEDTKQYVCPRCKRPIVVSCRRTPPWSRKGKRWERNAKYRKK